MVDDDATADKLPEIGGLCRNPLLFIAYDFSQRHTRDPHESRTEYQPLFHPRIVDEVEGERGNSLMRPELPGSMAAGGKDD